MNRFLLATIVFCFGIEIKPVFTECTDLALFTHSKGSTCQEYKDWQYCSNEHSTWMKTYCRRTCGFCKPPPGADEIHAYIYIATVLDVNMALVSGTFKTANVTSLEECFDLCSIEALCYSVNFEMDAGNVSICELSNRTKSSEVARERSGFIHYERLD